MYFAEAAMEVGNQGLPSPHARAAASLEPTRAHPRSVRGEVAVGGLVEGEVLDDLAYLEPVFHGWTASTGEHVTHRGGGGSERLLLVTGH